MALTELLNQVNKKNNVNNNKNNNNVNNNNKVNNKVNNNVNNNKNNVANNNKVNNNKNKVNNKNGNIEEGFMNMNLFGLQINRTCLLLIIIFTLIIMYKEDIMKTSFVKELLK